MALDTGMVTRALSSNQNKFVTVKFLNKSGEERTYNGRMNVIKGLKGNEKGTAVAKVLTKHGYVTLKTSGGYKCFKLDQVLAFKANGRHVFGLGHDIK